MKRVNKNYTAIPRSIRIGSHFYDQAIVELETLRAWPNPCSTIYRSISVHKSLMQIYGKKCGFCNQRTKGSTIQIEHFRPKNKLFELVGHSGYYWLGYEWTNLLYACGNCNSRKGNKFQISDEDDRIQEPAWVANTINQQYNKIFEKSLRKEKFDLLNPEIDYPEKHLVYLPDGKLYHLTDRGEYTIELLDLNRDELYTLGRKKILDDIISKLHKRLKRYSANIRDLQTVMVDVIDIIEEEILIPIEKNDSFDHFLSVIYHEYQKYIIPRFGLQSHKTLLSIIFSKLNQGITIS